MKSTIKKDIIAVFLPAIICILVFLLPLSWQQALALNSLKLNFWSWLTNIFVHQNITHLSFNLIIYFIAIFVGYFTLPKDDRKQFSKFIFILIIISSMFIFLFETLFRILHIIPQVLNQRGFSGITAVSLGFLCFSLSRRLQIRTGNRNSLNILLTFIYFSFLPSLAIIAWNLSMKLSAIIFILWIIVILLSIRSHKNKNEQLTKFNRLSWKESITYGLIMLILFGGVGFLVPPKININGTIIDILAHLLGFIAGLAISFWFIILKNKNKKI